MTFTRESAAASSRSGATTLSNPGSRTCPSLVPPPRARLRPILPAARGARPSTLCRVDDARLEEQLHAVGERLWQSLPPSARNPLKAADEKAMELASQDAELKAALFRFVDVVPAC